MARPLKPLTALIPGGLDPAVARAFDATLPPAERDPHPTRKRLLTKDERAALDRQEAAEGDAEPTGGETAP